MEIVRLLSQFKYPLRSIKQSWSYLFNNFSVARVVLVPPYFTSSVWASRKILSFYFKFSVSPLSVSMMIKKTMQNFRVCYGNAIKQHFRGELSWKTERQQPWQHVMFLFWTWRVAAEALWWYLEYRYSVNVVCHFSELPCDPCSARTTLDVVLPFLFNSTWHWPP